MTAPDSEPYAAIQKQASAWWTQLRSSELTRSDADAFRQWCAQSPDHARAWREVMRVWEGLEPVLADAERRDPLVAYPDAVGRGAIHRPGRRAFLGAAAAGAAGVLALRPPLALWPSVMELAADYRTGTGEQRQLALSDDITVQMNTQTRINVRAGEPSGEGIELVAGEAEILANLAPEQPFTVYAGGGRLVAQSARFNIRHTGPDVCVTCMDGAVEINHANQSRILKAGEQVVYDARGLRTAASVDPASVSAWRTGSLSFVGKPLAEVVDEINRYRPGRVILRNPELAAHLVRMRFSIHQTDTAIAMIRDLYGARVTELPGGIVLLG